MPQFLQLDRSVDVAPDVLGKFMGIPVTNTLVTAMLVTVVVFVFGILFKQMLTLKPGVFQNAFEYLYEAMVDLNAQITGNKTLAEETTPLVTAVLVYIGLANLIMFVPGLNGLTFNDQKLLRTPTSDLNLPLALAAGTMVFIHIRAVVASGVFNYIGRYLKMKELVDGFRKGFKDGMLALVEFFVGILDVIAELAKVISLSFRLFGNMFAGELLAVLILSGFAYALPAVWMSLNLLFAVVQALVFGALVASYYTLAVSPEGDPTEPEAGLKSS